MDTAEKAHLLLRSIRAELARGTEHYNRAGKKLETIEEVLQCLLDEDGVYVKLPGEIADAQSESLVRASQFQGTSEPDA